MKQRLLARVGYVLVLSISVATVSWVTTGCVEDEGPNIRLEDVGFYTISTGETAVNPLTETLLVVRTKRHYRGPGRGEKQLWDVRVDSGTASIATSVAGLKDIRIAFGAQSMVLLGYDGLGDEVRLLNPYTYEPVTELSFPEKARSYEVAPDGDTMLVEAAGPQLISLDPSTAGAQTTLGNARSYARYLRQANAVVALEFADTLTTAEGQTIERRNAEVVVYASHQTGAVGEPLTRSTIAGVFEVRGFAGSQMAISEDDRFVAFPALAGGGDQTERSLVVVYDRHAEEARFIDDATGPLAWLADGALATADAGGSGMLLWSTDDAIERIELPRRVVGFRQMQVPDRLLVDLEGPDALLSRSSGVFVPIQDTSGANVYERTDELWFVANNQVHVLTLSTSHNATITLSIGATTLDWLPTRNVFAVTGRHAMVGSWDVDARRAGEPIDLLTARPQPDPCRVREGKVHVGGLWVIKGSGTRRSCRSDRMNGPLRFGSVAPLPVDQLEGLALDELEMREPVRVGDATLDLEGEVSGICVDFRLEETSGERKTTWHFTGATTIGQHHIEGTFATYGPGSCVTTGEFTATIRQ